LIKRNNHLQTLAAFERFVKSIHIEKPVYFTKLYPDDVISTEVVTVSDLDAQILFTLMLCTESKVVLVQLVHLCTKIFYLCRVT
jgi:hypothetical protein